jgi:predicted transposase/invertase (TIGR01784 family)
MGKTQDNEEIIVEMQMENSDNFIKRSEYIASKLYSSQDLKGKYYDELNNVAIVGVLNFTLFNNHPEKFNFCFRYTEKDEKFELSDHIESRFVELTKLTKLLEKPVDQLTKKEMWALFFRYAADSSKKDLIKTIIQKEEGNSNGF